MKMPLFILHDNETKQFLVFRVHVSTYQHFQENIRGNSFCLFLFKFRLIFHNLGTKANNATVFQNPGFRV